MTHLAPAAAPPRVRGACPGVVDAMETADGWLMRVRTPGGRISAHGLREVAEVSNRFGSGLVEITSRANLQIRGLAATDLEAAAVELVEAGLADPDPAVDARRSIVASPLAGHDPTELVDVTPLLTALLEALAAADLSGELHPRFGIVLDGGGECSVRSIPADIGLGAVRDGSGTARWQLAIGAALEGAASLPLLSTATTAGDLIELVLAITRACAAQGCRARDLPDDRLPASGWSIPSNTDPADSRSEGDGQSSAVLGLGASTAKGSSERPRAFDGRSVASATERSWPGADAQGLDAATRSPGSIGAAEVHADQVTTRTGRAGHAAAAATPIAASAGPRQRAQPSAGIVPTSVGEPAAISGGTGRAISAQDGVGDPRLGRFPHPDADRVNLVAAAFLGRMDAPALARLAHLVESLPRGVELRLAPGGGIVLVGVPHTELARTLETLAELGLATDPTDPAQLVSACVGSPGCASSRGDTLATARGLVADTDRLRAMGRVHFSGCEKLCGAPGTGTVLVADHRGFFVPDPLRGDGLRTKNPTAGSRPPKGLADDSLRSEHLGGTA